MIFKSQVGFNSVFNTVAAHEFIMFDTAESMRGFESSDMLYQTNYQAELIYFFCCVQTSPAALEADSQGSSGTLTGSELSQT